VVTKAAPAITTTPSGSVPSGGKVSDSATLRGGYSPRGSVVFTLYGPGDTTCTTPIATTTGSVNGGSTSSSEVTVGPAGTYNWVATYGGDANNESVTSPCGSEPVNVTAQRMTGRAYGVSASVTSFPGKLIKLKPTPDTGSVSTTSSSSTSTPCLAKLGDVLSARVLCANVTTNGFPARSTASASLADVTVGTLADSCEKSESSMRNDLYQKSDYAKSDDSRSDSRSYLKSDASKSDASKSDACTKTDSSMKSDLSTKTAVSLKTISSSSKGNSYDDKSHSDDKSESDHDKSRSDDEPTVFLRSVKSTSTTTCGGSSGTTTIDYLLVGNRVVIAAPTQVAPNTTINVGLVKLVLNEQIPFNIPDKGLTVNAVHATLNALGLAKVDVVVASSESGIGNCP
jgi:hypothetical protein